MSLTKKLLILILAVAVAWVALNFDYFRKNVEFALRGDRVPDAGPVQEKMETDTLIVPSLNITAPIKYAEAVNEVKFQELLIDGVVHYPDTALPGKPGNVYIFGHSSDNAWAAGHYKTVFALLPRMKIGNEIFISDQEGSKFVYKVVETRVVSNNDLSVLSQGDGQRKLLTLQTSYPIGTSLKRFVVIGELVE